MKPKKTLMSKPLPKKAAVKKDTKSGKKLSGRELIERGMADRTFI